ncbi:MAG: DUF262 domain-containing protein [Lentisphaeria bacterium]
MNFFIPDYQRGYRWGKVQIEQLLGDIRDFYETNEGFYCLQPVVVRKCDNKLKDYKLEGDLFEIIDGQQRLTTIYIILQYFGLERIKEDYPNFAFFNFFYDTRRETEEFLKNIKNDRQKSMESADFYCMSEVYDSIVQWFKKELDSSRVNKNRFLTAILSKRLEEERDIANNLRFIWYEADADASAPEIFNRLNVGRIPLTDAELIKAMFLQNKNFGQDNLLKQLQIATEWDRIEQKLWDNSFWYFLQNGESGEKFSSRIGLIFKLLWNKEGEDADYKTFIEFCKEFEKEKATGRIEILWKKVKDCFQKLEEWYNNREFYHKIGYLIALGGKKLKDILELFDNAPSRKDFLNSLDYEIEESLGKVNLDDMNYNNNKTEVRKVLLLFNVMTIQNLSKHDTRFSFQNYKEKKWDIEHISPQTEKEMLRVQELKEWTLDMLDYLGNCIDEDDKENRCLNEDTFKKALDTSNDELAEILEQLKKTLERCKDGTLLASDKFKNLQKQIENYIGFDELENVDGISNLALLSMDINRSYLNAFFPVKRKRIIYEDKHNNFVPIATKNAFLKYYSTKNNDPFNWTKQDAEDYLKAIKTVLKNYLSELSEENK